MKQLAFIAIAAACVFCSVANSEESFSDLEGSAASKEFTQAERRYSTEALDRYKKYELHGDFKIRSNIAWLDNDHIVFSARKLPDWEAIGDEHSRVIAMNVVTGEYKDTGYRGRLMCLNHLGDLMIRQGGNEIIVNSSSVRYEWLIGKWGEVLTSAPRPDNSRIMPYLCRFSPYGDQIYTTPKEKLTEDMHRKILLLPGHGYLRETVEYVGEKATYPVYYVKADGSMRRVADKVPLYSDFHFYPWLNAYYERAPLIYGPRVFYTSGEFRAIPIPKLLKYWSDNSAPMSAAGVLTKAGMLWDVHQGRGYWKKQGLYLDSPKGLLRVEEGSGVHSIISPDGCRILDSILRGDLYKTSLQVYTWLVIDICMDKK